MSETISNEMTRKRLICRITAAELRKLSASERATILRAVAKKAAPDYEPGGELYVAGNEDIVIA